eukprot:353919-Chlamydomonas_euryale.AAC.4
MTRSGDGAPWRVPPCCRQGGHERGAAPPHLKARTKARRQAPWAERHRVLDGQPRPRAYGRPSCLFRHERASPTCQGLRICMMDLLGRHSNRIPKRIS